MPRAGSDEDKPAGRPSDLEDGGGKWHELPLRCRRIASPRMRRLVLARIDSLLAARGPKAG